jgi:DNA-binding NarL/FixJ family response regulator
MHAAISQPNTMESNTLEYGKQKVDAFLMRFNESYRLLLYHAAIPLLLTPELLNYLRNRFLRGQVPWIADADILLSELCEPVGYELYAMEAGVRAHLLQELHEALSDEHISRVASLLIHYVQVLARDNSYYTARELASQRWAAMVYLGREGQQSVAHEMARAMHTSLESLIHVDPSQSLMEPELLYLARLAKNLENGLRAYPQFLKYAEQVTRLLEAPDTIIPDDLISQRTSVAKVDLPPLKTHPIAEAAQPQKISDVVQDNKPESFAHKEALPTSGYEVEFARLLTYYGIDWEYEPNQFPLQWRDGKPTELFAPDFYLPEYDLYIELTTMRQALVRRKNRKLRLMRALYPNLNIKLLYRRDYQRLLERFGIPNEELLETPGTLVQAFDDSDEPSLDPKHTEEVPLVPGQVPSSHRILFVANQVEYASVLQDVIEKLSRRTPVLHNIPEIIEAHSPAEALRIVANGNVAIAVVELRLQDTSDSQDISGLVLAEQLKAKLPLIAVILVSDNAPVKAVNSALVDGTVYEYVRKDIGSAALVQAISHALRFVGMPDDLAILDAFSRRVTILEKAGNSDGITSELLKVALQLTHAPYGLVFLKDSVRNSLVVRASEPKGSEGISVDLSTPQAGVARMAVETKQVYHINDVEEVKRFHYYSPLPTAWHSMVVVPIIIVEEAEAIGLVSLTSSQPAYFSNRDLDVLQTLVGITAVPLANALAQNRRDANYRIAKDPFIVGMPIKSAAQFFNRKDEMRRVLELIKRGTSVSVVGPRRIGKTSFLLAVMRRLQRQKGNRCIYIDMQSVPEEGAFYNQLLEELRTSDLFVIDELEKQKESAPTLSTREEVHRLLRQTAHTEHRHVLLLDEFEVAATSYGKSAFSDSFFGSLRAWASLDLVTLLIATSISLFDLTLDSRIASPFANIFQRVVLGEFKLDDATKLATFNGKVPFSPHEVQFIVDTARGKPFFIQMLASMLLLAKNANSGNVDLSDIHKQFVEVTKWYS